MEYTEQRPENTGEHMASSVGHYRVQLGLLLVVRVDTIRPDRP